MYDYPGISGGGGGGGGDDNIISGGGDDNIISGGGDEIFCGNMLSFCGNMLSFCGNMLTFCVNMLPFCGNMLPHVTGEDICLKEGEPINALMYADDLIIISESKEGLQKQLNKLNEYCKKWKLEVNIKKTKIMIFNRAGQCDVILAVKD